MGAPRGWRSPNSECIAENLANPGMFATASNPRIGYDAAVGTGEAAPAGNLTLKDAAAKLGLVSPEDSERWVRPEQMVEPRASLGSGWASRPPRRLSIC